MAHQKRTLTSLHHNPENPRRITDERLRMLEKSLAEFGDLSPIVFNVRSGQLIGGHQRQKVLLGKFGDADITITQAYEPVTSVGTVREGYVLIEGERFAYREVDFDENRERLANLAANRGAGDFDEEGLKKWLAELGNQNLDLDLSMFDADERGVLLDDTPLIFDDETAADEEATVSPSEAAERVRLGQIWQLGSHRLMCEDSRENENIAKLMNGAKADMVYTDPPYGMNLKTDYSQIKGSKKSKLNRKYKGKVHRQVIGDHADFTCELIDVVFENFGYCKEIFLWGADYYAELLDNKNEGAWVVWDKRLDENSDKIVGSCFELCWSKAKHKRLICRMRWTGVFGLEEARNRVHPTQKPSNLAQWFFSRWGREGDIVVDLYGGSGSTLLACEKDKRTCYMAEIDPRYCDVIIARWEKLTGRTAELAQ